MIGTQEKYQQRLREWTGKQIGYLTAVSVHDSVKVTGGTVVRWLARCVCGNTTVVPARILTHGGRYGCGCRRVRLLRLFEKHVTKTDGCWEWYGCRSNGYGSVHLSAKESIRAHRASYELFTGPIPDGLLVCHRCDNPPCVRPDHLFIGTSNDNTQDMIRKGRKPFGERCTKAKLTNEQVAEIYRSVTVRGETYHSLAKRFGVSDSCIGSIFEGRSWRKVVGQIVGGQQ